MLLLPWVEKLFWSGFVLVFSFLCQTPALPAALPRAHRKTLREANRQRTPAAGWVMAHTCMLRHRGTHHLWGHCTQTHPVDLWRCGFARRWEETAQRGHNYSAASSPPTSSFCSEESLTKQLVSFPDWPTSQVGLATWLPNSWLSSRSISIWRKAAKKPVWFSAIQK